MSDKIYRVQMNRKGAPDFSTAVEIADRPQGEWVRAMDGYDMHVKCTSCFKTYDWNSEAQYYNFCPNCGARMKGADDV